MTNDFNDWQNNDSAHAHGNALMVLHRLLRGRYIMTFAMAGVLAVIGALIGFLTQQPMYQSYGRIHIKPRVTRILYDNEQNTTAREFSGLVSSQTQYLRSSRVLSLALESDGVRKLRGVSELYAPEQISEGLRVRTDRKLPEFVTVNYEHVNRAVAQSVVVAVIDSYMELYGSRENKLNRPEVLNTLHSRMSDLDKDRENIMSQIETETNVWSTDNLGLLIRNAIASIRQIESQQIELQSQIDQYEAFAIQSEGETPDDISIERAAQFDQMMASLLSKQISLEDAYEDLISAGLGERHHDVKLVVAAIKNVDQRIANRLADIRDGSAKVPGLGPDGIVSSLDELRLRLQNVNGRLAEAREEQQKMGKADLHMQRLVDQREQIDKKIAEVDARIDEIKTESQIENFTEDAQRIRVIESGVTPSVPSSDRRRKMAALGFFGGGAIPIAVMLGLGLLNRSVRFSDDQILSGSSGIVGMLPDLGNALDDQELAEASAFAVHQVRSQLQILDNKKEHGLVYEVTSPSSQDGKTSLIIAMGLSFAESGDRTLLLDLDLIGRGLSIHFGYPNAPSLVNGITHLEQISDLVKPTDFEGLSVLPAGFGDDVEISKLSPTVVRKLLDSLREQYDTILVDTGPILGSIEAGFVAAEADGVMLVVGRGQLRPLIRRAVDQINGVGGKIVATIFNRASGYELRQSTGTMSVHFSRQAARQAAEVAMRAGPRVGPVAGTLFTDRKQKTEKNHDKDDKNKAV